MCQISILPSRLTELRKARNLTQEELAAAISVSNKTVSKWERGESAPDLAALTELAKYFEVSTDYLLGVGSAQCQTLTEVINSMIKEKSRNDAILTAFDIARAVIRSVFSVYSNNDEIGTVLPIPENDSPATCDCITGSNLHNFTVRSDNVNLAVMLLKNKSDFEWMFEEETQQKICRLFAFLSDTDAIKLCAFIHSKKCSASFTADHAAKNAEISVEKAIALLEAAVEIKLCTKSTAHLGTGEVDVYNSFGNGNILTMICIAYEYMCDMYGGYNYYHGGKCKMISGEN